MIGIHLGLDKLSITIAGGERGLGTSVPANTAVQWSRCMAALFSADQTGRSRHINTAELK